jgi:hypothetical protein
VLYPPPPPPPPGPDRSLSSAHLLVVYCTDICYRRG